MSKKKTATPKPKPEVSKGTSKPLVYGPVHVPSGKKEKPEPKKP
jgi:hypothetical protein